MSVPMILSDLERQEASGQVFQADLVNNARIAFDYTTTKFGTIAYVGRGVYF